MRWQIEGFVFCDQQQSLTHNGNTQQLEPILVALLAYFCQQPDKIISRDELVAAVWLGRTVTDSAVNRAITKLRRCLADDAKTPRFIATFPKKGYKFIAVANKITPEHIAASPSGTIEQPALIARRQTASNRLLYTAVAVIAVAIGLLWQQGSDSAASVFTAAKPLTRSAGQEWQPRLSRDQQYLTYTEITANNMQLFIKQLSDGRTIEMMPEAEADAWVGPASWSPAGDKIVYLLATKDYCRYYLQTFAAMTLGEPQLIHNCPAGSYGKIAFTHNDKLLVYTERAAADAPYELFTLELATGKKRKLNQPPLVLAGNVSFDLHPTQNKLLVSSVDEQMWERFYSLDLATDALELLFKLDSYICCGIWDHSGERIVLMGEHPAVQLISYDLQGKDRQVIYAGSQQLHEPERHPNGHDYMFAAGSSNLDVQFYRFSSRQTQQLANTSVGDRLAVVSPQQDKVAYVGLATGTEEIWLTDIDGQNQRQLSHFRDQRHFLDLAWSPDGKQLVATLSISGNAQLYVVGADGGEPRRLTQTESIDTEPVFSADGKSIYFVSDRGGSPQIYRMAAQGGNAQRVTFSGNYNISPSISPDGRYLAFISRVNGAFRLHVMELASGDVTALTDSSADESPSFSPNGRMIIYATRDKGQESLMTTSLDGRIKTRLAGAQGDIREPEWGPFLR